MDSDGTVLAVQPGFRRTVDGFAKTLHETVLRYVDLRAKAEAGDAAAQIDFAMLKCDLGQMEFEALQKEIAGKTLTDEQKRVLKSVEAGATLTAAKKAIDQGRGNKEAFRAAAQGLVDALQKDLVPEAAERRQEFFSILFNYGMLEKDPDLAEKALAGIRVALTEMLGDISRFEASLQAAEKKIADLRAEQEDSGCGEEEGEEGIEEGGGD